MAIKLKELTIEHIKNVDHGTIKFYDSNGYINLLGIYGQNGSGKTTVVDTMEIVKYLMMGESIPEHSMGIFNTKGSTSLPRVLVEFEKENEFVLRYEVEFISNESNLEQTVLVANETIFYKKGEPNERFKRLVRFSILEALEQPEMATFGQLSSRSKILSADAIELLTGEAMRNQTSFLFSKGFKDRIQRLKGSLLEKEIFDVFNDFCEHIRVYTQRSANLTGMGAIPININYRDEKHGFQGAIPVILQKGGSPVPVELVPVYQQTIQYMNDIIPVIIPNLTLDMNIGDVQINENGTEYRNISFFANRSGKVFSLIHESEGIRKIISMIGVLIEVFNNEDTIAVIDELDSGIFEYLLGELMQIFSEDVKGQLIFTSHNLRILEMLPTRQIRFSTNNQENRYIYLKGVKSTNNLRDVYLRLIQLGGDEEELYSGKSQAKIRRALRKAGESIGK